MKVRPEVWVKNPGRNGIGILYAWVEGGITEYPTLIETHCASSRDVLMDTDQDFEIVLECAERPNVYADEEAYKHSGEHSPMASESVISLAKASYKENEFSLYEDETFGENEIYDPTPHIILNGRVVMIHDPLQYGFDEGDVLYTVSCLNNVYAAILPAALASDTVIKEGNIVSCVYWVRGWPKEE